jgi:hypothetical protein
MFTGFRFEGASDFKVEPSSSLNASLIWLLPDNGVICY